MFNGVHNKMVSLLLLKQMFSDSGKITWDSALLESSLHFCYMNTFAFKYAWAFCTVLCVTIWTEKFFFIKQWIQMKADTQGTTRHNTSDLPIGDIHNVSHIPYKWKRVRQVSKVFHLEPVYSFINTLLVSDTSSGPLAFLLPLTAVAAYGIGRLNFAASFSLTAWM